MCNSTNDLKLIINPCRHGDYKLILGYPGLTDGWEQHGNKGQAHIEAILTNGNYTGDLTENPPEVEYDWDAVMEYARMVNDSVLLFNIKGNVGFPMQ